MQFLLNPFFWAAVVVLYPLQYIPLPFSRSVVFGVTNLVIIGLLLGLSNLLVAFSFGALIWVLGDLLQKSRAAQRLDKQRAIALSSVAGILCLLIAYKLGRTDGFVASLLCGAQPCGSKLVFGAFVALSSSYAALRCLDYVVSIWNGAKATDPLSLFGYLFPFHMLIAGPICSYKNFLTINEEPLAPVSFSRLIRAVNTIATGLFYKFVIAELLRIYQYGVAGQIVADSWTDSAFLLVYLFFDFAGYSLIALGVGLLCQIPTPANFRAPFRSQTVTEFFTRWHISLGDFVRTNVFIPMQVTLLRRLGVSAASVASICTISVSFILVGLWHRVSVGFLLWGLFLALVMVVEKVVADRVAAAAVGHRVLNLGWTIVGPVYVFVVVSTSIHLVAGEVF